MGAAPLAFIESTGARGPLGLSSVQIAMCLRAGRTEPRASRFVGQDGEDLGATRTLAIAETVFGYDRLLRLAGPALAEALEPDVAPAPPLVLALPERGRADDDSRLNGAIFHDLAKRSRRAIDASRSLVLREGHAAGTLALEAAAAMLAKQDGPARVVVGGADSLYHPGVLGELDRTRRVHGPGADDGFIPGEGAAFVVLRRAREGRPPLACLRAVANAREATLEDDEPSAPNLGAAMTEVVRAMRSDGPVRWVLSDLNGERYRLREWTMALTRVLSPDDPLHHRLGEEMGDAGAATGPMAIAIACAWIAAGCAPGESAVIALASDGPARGAARIEVVS